MKESLQKKWGVHILFKQAVDGSVILGDSHQYADAPKIEDLGYELDMDIDNFMIEEAKKIIDILSSDELITEEGVLAASFKTRTCVPDGTHPRRYACLSVDGRRCVARLLIVFLLGFWPEIQGLIFT